MVRQAVEVTVERGSRSGRMVYVRRADGLSVALWVQRRRVEWPDGVGGRALFRPTPREQKLRGWGA